MKVHNAVQRRENLLMLDLMEAEADQEDANLDVDICNTRLGQAIGAML